MRALGPRLAVTNVFRPSEVTRSHRIHSKHFPHILIFVGFCIPLQYGFLWIQDPLFEIQRNPVPRSKITLWLWLLVFFWSRFPWSPALTLVTSVSWIFAFPFTQTEIDWQTHWQRRVHNEPMAIQTSPNNRKVSMTGPVASLRSSWLQVGSLQHQCSED